MNLIYVAEDYGSMEEQLTAVTSWQISVRVFTPTMSDKPEASGDEELGRWMDFSNSDTHKVISRLGSVDDLCSPGDLIHAALDQLPKDGDLLLIWEYYDGHSFDEELLGAVLRASLCHSAQVVVLSTSKRPLTGCWLDDMIHYTARRDLAGMTLPQWRGMLQLDGSTSIELSLFSTVDTTIFDGDNKYTFPDTSWMELAELVNLTNVHKFLLSELYSVVMPSNECGTVSEKLRSLKQDKQTGYLIRMCIPLEARPPGRRITTTRQWMQCVLQGDLPKKDLCQLYESDAKYHYFLLFYENSGYYMYRLRDQCLELSRLVNLSQHCRTDSCADSAESERRLTEILDYLGLSDDSPMCGASLCTMADFLLTTRPGRTVKEISDTILCWPERLRLTKFSKQKEAAKKRNTSHSPEQQCKITIDMVLNKFNKDGKPKNPVYCLPTGNKQREEMTTATWPLCQYFYGPGIYYNRADDCTVNTTNGYRDRQTFFETSSMFNSDVMQKPPEKTIKQQKDQQRRSNELRRSPRKAVRVQYNKPTKVTSAKERTPSAKRKASGSDVPPQCQLSTRERNNRNKQRMQIAVDRALKRHGVVPGNSSYTECSRRLFEISLAGVKKLKTSVNLDKKMKEITLSFAPAIVTTFKD